MNIWFAVVVGGGTALIALYLVVEFLHGMREFDIDDLEPLSNGRRDR